MHEQIKRKIVGASSVALATTGPAGLNVVPLSVWEVVGDEVHLYDFFMNKTAENLRAGGPVVLTCWQGFSGVQVKAAAVYETSGEVYEEAVKVMKERFPDRVLRAVIRLTPTEAYSVAPGASGEDLLG
jgi:predicted pyridoxine 5'-phosphate oxidase superfamily flavin-nucleotide-binding protein